MDQSQKHVETRPELPDAKQRANWQRPRWRKLEAREAQLNVNANTDGGAFS